MHSGKSDGLLYLPMTADATGLCECYVKVNVRSLDAGWPTYNSRHQPAPHQSLNPFH